MPPRSDSTPVDRTDTWCVVGAGSSGIAAAKNLREHGFEAICFEREDDIGGNWNFGRPNSRVYASTHLISSKPFTQYPDFPMPDRFPDYPHHSHMMEYFRAYVRHFGLQAVIEFSTSVEAMQPAADGRFWDVEVARADGRRERFRFAGVVIANGHNWYPKMPDYPGQFTGEVIHSADYKGPEILRGKRVLVVGAGNTGCDIAVEAAQNAAQTFHSTRRGYWYALKYTMGKPSDQVNDLILSLGMPRRGHQWLLERTLQLTTGDVTRAGLKAPDHRMLETHPIVNQQLVYYVGHGEITPVDDVERFEGDKVVFAGGRIEEVDLVVYCTGYLVQFPFIEHRHLNWWDDHPRLYLNVFPPDHDNLFVCGLIQPDSGQFKLVHWQSVAIAKFLEALRERPAAADRFRRLRRDPDATSLSGRVRYKESTRHYFEVNHYTYLQKLEEIIHVLEGGRVSHGTKIMEPLRWALPPAAVEREVLTRLPEGPTDKPPLLFVHGLAHGAWCWDQHWMPAAAARGWPCYAVSLRGHGGSEGAERIRRWKLRDYEHDVMQAIIDLPRQPVLIGHSMGALVVRRVLARYPARAGVLVAPAGARHGLGILGQLARHQPGQILRALTLQPVRLRHDALFAGLPEEQGRAYEQRLTDDSPLAQLEITAAPRPATSKAPVLVLGGGDDRLVPVTDVVRTARRYGTRAHVFRRVGHDLMLDAGWRAPLERMLDWLDETLG